MVNKVNKGEECSGSSSTGSRVGFLNLTSNVLELKLEINEMHADIIGEYLRDLFFDQSSGQIGCYSTFAVNDWVERISDDVRYDEYMEEDEIWYRFRTDAAGCLVTMEYHWDGDGTLRFLFGDYILENTDCKKSYGWELEPIRLPKD